MYYKDKKFQIKNFFRSEMYYLLNRSQNLRFILIFVIFLLVYYFYSLTRSNDHHIIDDLDSSSNQINKQGPYYRRRYRKTPSVIIDKISSQQADDENGDGDDDDGLPLHVLVSQYKNGMFLYNMEESVESWWPFECVETRMQHSINTKICIHDPKYDTHISSQLKENGLWEPVNVRSFLKQLNEIPDANLVDIGANIGLYTLLAAKMNRSVIAVEPLHDNLNRLHKAAQLESVQSRIVALVNAVSNMRDEVKISILDYNVGGSYIVRPEMVEKQKRFNPVSSSVIVNSILMDDLVDVFNDKIRTKIINSRENKTLSRKFVLKLDIEGHEPFIFESSNKFFKTFQIVAIFMEFGKILEKLDKIDLEKNPAYLHKIKHMLKVFQDLNYEPYEVNGFNKMEYKNWREWPWDIYLRKCDLTNCPNHEYKAEALAA